MELRHVILHEVRRENKKSVERNLRPNENDIKGLGEELTSQLLDLFAQANLNVGEFSINNDTKVKPPFEQKLEEHYDKSNKTESFVNLTRDLANNYYNIINELSNVKGGILIFYEYEGQAKNIFLGVVIVERISGINASNEKLDLNKTNIIDLNSLHLGASINLTKWRLEENSRYIKFKAGRIAEIRKYFKGFIGCQLDKEAATRETRNLKKAIKNYAKTLELNDDQTQEKLDIVSKFIKKQTKDNKDPLLSEIANAIFPDSTKGFLGIAKKEPYELSENITISTAELKKFTRIGGSGKGVNISFDNELLGSTVIYSADKRTLLFKEPPDKLIESIQEELADRSKESEE